jgi:predicted GNAT family acetyltransferase
MGELAVYSPVDTDRFGKRIYRAYLRDAGEVRALDAFAREKGIEMVIARCPVASSDVVHALEACGHRLMDTLVYYAGSTGSFEPVVVTHTIRRAVPSDRDALQAIAFDAFTNYQGHYHADPRLDPALATLGYVDWCVSLIARAGHVMWVATEGEKVTGFLAVRLDEAAAEIVLNAVGSSFQRRGIYDNLVKVAGQNLRRDGIKKVRVSTQLSNLAPQKVWSKNGMCIDEAVYTFHKWFET